MHFPTLEEQSHQLSNLTIPNSLSRNIAASVNLDPQTVHNLVLDTTLGRNFRNPEVNIRVAGPEKPVEIFTTGKFADFMAMSGRRTDEKTNTDNWKSNSQAQFEGLQSNEGISLSNVGVSLALTVKHAGKEYAILITRNVKDDLGNPKIRLMLPSGYVDAAKLFNHHGNAAFDPATEGLKIGGRSLFVANALAEGAEELLSAEKPGWFGLAEVNRGMLSQEVLGELAFLHGKHIKRFGCNDVVLAGPYDDLSYSDNVHQRLKFTQLPNHITNVFPSRSVIVDGQELPGAGFQIHEHTNSGQIILGGELSLPEFLTEEASALFSILHAEDGPGKLDGQPGDLLATTVNTFGTIFCELDPETKMLTSNFYNFMTGSMLPALHLGGVDNLMVSDAFVEKDDSWSNKSGFLSTPHIPFSQYLNRYNR